MMPRPSLSSRWFSLDDLDWFIEPLARSVRIPTVVFVFQVLILQIGIGSLGRSQRLPARAFGRRSLRRRRLLGQGRCGCCHHHRGHDKRHRDQQEYALRSATSFITATSHRVAPYPHESKGR